MRYLKSIFIILSVIITVNAQTINTNNNIEDKSGRQFYKIDNDWLYLENNTNEINDIHLASSKWEKINLPHTWNRYDNVDAEPGYRRDASWYQKNIFIPKLSRKQNIMLYFEGANITTDVYVNNKFAGKHVGGYVGFEIDITPLYN